MEKKSEAYQEGYEDGHNDIALLLSFLYLKFNVLINEAYDNGYNAGKFEAERKIKKI